MHDRILHKFFSSLSLFLGCAQLKTSNLFQLVMERNKYTQRHLVVSVSGGFFQTEIFAVLKKARLEIKSKLNSNKNYRKLSSNENEKNEI